MRRKDIDCPCQSDENRLYWLQETGLSGAIHTEQMYGARALGRRQSLNAPDQTIARKACAAIDRRL
jgi:hypothetical protein